MRRRTERVARLIRDTVGQVVLTRLSDPRIDPARTSIVRVEMPDDLLSAKVYVSYLGEPAEQRKALRALKHAAGHIQELMMQEISLRHTPVLDFQIDTKFKKTMETLAVIEKISDELREKDQASAEGAGDGPADSGSAIQG